MTPPIPSLRLLLAEDDPVFRELLESELRAAGFEVVSLTDGRELLLRLIRELEAGGQGPRPDLVVSDVRMPGFDGLSVLEALHRTGVHLPVVLISAFADPELHAQARAAGAFAVLEKPFEIEALLGVLDQARHTLVPARISAGTMPGT